MLQQLAAFYISLALSQNTGRRNEQASCSSAEPVMIKDCGTSHLKRRFTFFRHGRCRSSGGLDMEVVGQITGGLYKKGKDPDEPSHMYAPAGHEFPRSAISPAV
jgi:hypothetical protein